MFKSCWKADVMWHNDTTSWSSPEPSEVSLAPFPSFSQGTKDGRRPRLGTGGSSGVWLSVSFFSVWEALGEASCKPSPGGGAGAPSSAGWLTAPMPRCRSPFSSFRMDRESIPALEDTRFLGEGGSSLPWRALSSCPRCHSACSLEPLQSRARLFSLGVLDLFWEKKQHI